MLLLFEVFIAFCGPFNAFMLMPTASTCSLAARFIHVFIALLFDSIAYLFAVLYPLRLFRYLSIIPMSYPIFTSTSRSHRRVLRFMWNCFRYGALIWSGLCFYLPFFLHCPFFTINHGSKCSLPIRRTAFLSLYRGIENAYKTALPLPVFLTEHPIQIQHIYPT